MYTSLHCRSYLLSGFIPVALAAVACGAAADQPQQIEQVYDSSGRLELLKYDSNGNGTIDTWSYMNGAQIVRIELDGNEDGIVDRWEYYTPEQLIEKVGSSRLADGNVDTWAYYGADGTVARLELSTRRDGTVNRTEYYEKDVMTRAEEDTNADARIDKWEQYQNGRLAAVAFDTTFAGAADRRLVYGPGGAVRLEVSPNRDGTFVPVGN